MNRKELFYISLTIFLTIIAWLIVDIYHAATEEKIKNKIEFPVIENYQIKPEVIENIQSRKP